MTVNHDAPLEAVQAQFEDVVTATDALAPAAPSEMDSGATL